MNTPTRQQLADLAYTEQTLIHTHDAAPHTRRNALLLGALAVYATPVVAAIAYLSTIHTTDIATAVIVLAAAVAWMTGAAVALGTLARRSLRRRDLARTRLAAIHHTNPGAYAEGVDRANIERSDRLARDAAPRDRQVIADALAQDAL